MQIGVDKKKLIAVMQAMEKEYGDGSMYTLDSAKANKQIPRWSTGLEDLDAILGGGMPYGRIIEISGPESAGKTTLAHHLTAQHEVAINIPIEGTFDNERAKLMGNRKGQLIVRRADYGEQCLETVLAVAETGVPIVVIDSVPFMITKRDFEEPDLEKESRGRIAALLAAKLPKIVTKCEKTNTTVIFINQLRDEQNAGLFGPQTHTPGGRALKHACSIRIEVRRVDWIKVPNKDPKNSAQNQIIGITMKVKVIKSKVCNPLGECVLAVLFDRGFVAVDEVIEIRKEIMRNNSKKVRSSKNEQ